MNRDLSQRELLRCGAVRGSRAGGWPSRGAAYRPVANVCSSHWGVPATGLSRTKGIAAWTGPTNY